MTGWILLWKTVLIVGLLLFAGMSVWIAARGGSDIKRLFKKLG